MWATNPSNTDPLKEIRRAFHTLKGSGRLVGASDLGEFAWAFENMLNRVLDNTIKVTTELLELMDRGNQALPELFELFKSAQKPKQNILSLMEYADAISKGESVNLDADINATPDADIEDIVELEIESENNLDEVTPSISEEDILEFDGESFELPDELETNEIHVAEEDIFDLVEEELIELVDEEPPPVDIDPTLLDIYRKEVVTHTQSLKDYVVDWNNGAIAANHTLLRALHTLTGSSRTTGVQPLALVCSALENYVKHLKDLEIDFPKAALNELENVISLIESTVDCLDKPGAVLPEYEQLLARIGALPKERKVAVTTPTESVSTAIKSSAEDIPLADYDEELLEIFLEEGTEILEESDQVIHNWKDDPSDIKYVEELQRHLHTLKGGARMAGIAELGDLGHSIESLLTAVVDGHMKATKPMLELVQRSQDELVHMLELVQAHKGIPAATDLIVQVDRMLKNRGEDDDLELAIEAPIEEEIEITQINDEVIAEEVNPTFASDEISELEQLEAELREEVNTEEITFPEIELSEPFDEIPELNIEVENISEVELIEEVPDLNIVVEEPKELIIPVEEVASLPVEVKAETNLAVEEQQQDRRQGGRVQAEQVRVRADLLDNLVNFAGEVSIYRSRLEQQTNNFRYNITEFDDTVNRLREQLRQFEIETETQIEYKSEELSSAQENFDPLEMDRFTTMQHLSRAMMESLGDLDSLRGILNNLTRESETLLLQQSRVNTDLQEGLMRTRMIPFSGQASRLRRIVRQTCGELGKHAELHLEGVDSELDRTILERIISPIEHMLRNAIAHGIETPEKRKSAGKDETGNIHFTISNEGSNILINIKDDGAGIDLEAIRNKGISKGLIKENAPVTKEQLLDMIMQSGFSTAESVSQIAGRGVGMDVVNTEIKQLGGIFNIDTEKGKGTSFTVSLPLTLAITRALMVTLGDDTYAIPLLSVEGVERITASKITEIIESDNQTYNWVDEEYKFMHLGTVMGTNEMALADETMQYPLLMVSSGEYKAAILVDSLLGSREIVVKSVGPQLSTLRGISGATVMGDGSVVLIIDLATLIRLAATTETTETVMPLPVVAEKVEHTTPLVMVVDDSITVRKVTTRLLERYEMRVVAAKDGVDALAQLQEIVPDIMLLDVEMPRMDGFELATNMRNDDRLKDIPIIMITSRTGQKHRDRAASIGVNIYMGKPFTETDLMDNINVLTGKDY